MLRGAPPWGVRFAVEDRNVLESCVKNTFLQFPEEGEEETPFLLRRCRSTPHDFTFTLGAPTPCSRSDGQLSDPSTCTATSDATSLEDEADEEAHSGHRPSKSEVLRSTALADVRSALERCEAVAGARIVQYPAARRILVSTSGDQARRRAILAVAQVSLVEAAKKSKNLCLLASSTKPFRVEEDSVRACLATIPEGQERDACWEYYKSGVCPRGSRCRWYHPRASDFMTVVVKLEPQEAPL